MSIPRVNGTTQACAACKYQRRKCAPDCLLAPYFPHDRQRQFLNAHKLFGVSNITKVIRNLDPPEKDIAMRTIIYQSDVRAEDPVGGCYRIIRELQRQIEFNKAELDLVLHQLAICRAQAHHHHQAQIQLLQESNDHHNVVVDPLNISSYNNDDSNPFYNYQQQHFSSAQMRNNDQDDDQEQYNIVQQQGHDQDQTLQDPSNNNASSSWVLQADSLSSSPPPPLFHVKQQHQHQQQPCFGNECDDLKPLLEVPYDRNEFKFEVDDTVDDQQSDRAVLDEDRVILEEQINASFQHVQDHDLKGAATLFTLTN